MNFIEDLLHILFEVAIIASPWILLFYLHRKDRKQIIRHASSLGLAILVFGTIMYVVYEQYSPKGSFDFTGVFYCLLVVLCFFVWSIWYAVKHTRKRKNQSEILDEPNDENNIEV